MDAESFLRRHFQDLAKGEVFMLRFKRESDNRIVQKMFSNQDDDFKMAAAMAKQASETGVHVFYGVNPYNFAKHMAGYKGRDAIERITHAWVDIDNVSTDDSKWAQTISRSLEGLPPYETMVSTGGGYQILWRYEHPIHEQELAQRTNRELALVLDGDVQATDPARTLRLPGTRNWKPKYPDNTYAVVTNHHDEKIDIEYLIDILPREYRPEVTSAPRTHDTDEVEFLSALRAIDPHRLSYDEWVRVLMAVHAFDSGPDGLAAAVAWADGKPGEVEIKWHSFRREGSSPATVFHFAREQGWRPETPATGTFTVEEDSPPTKKKTVSGISLTPMHDFLGEIDEGPKWVVDDLLNKGGTSLLVAKQKVGKSTFAANLAVAVASGLPFLGHHTHQGAVHIYSLEVHRAFLREQYRHLIAAYGLTSAPDIAIHASTHMIDNALDAIAKIVTDQRPSLIILDPLAKVLSGLSDSNSYTEVYRAMTPIISLAEQSGTHIVCIHHTNKGLSEGSDSVMGSVGFAASVDLTMMLRRDREANIRTLDIEARHLPEADTIAFDFDEDRKIVELGDKEAVIKSTAEKRILTCIGANPGISLAEIKQTCGVPSELVGPIIFRLAQVMRVRQDEKTKRYTLMSYTPGPAAPEPQQGGFIV